MFAFNTESLAIPQSNDYVIMYNSYMASIFPREASDALAY